VVGPLDGHAPQQVRVNFVAGRRAAQARFGIQGFDAQDAHQPLDAFAVHLQLERHPAAAEEGTLQVLLVQPPQQAQVLGALRSRLIVVGRARQTQQVALLLDGQVRMVRVDP